MVKREYKETKTIIKKSRLVNDLFVCKYSISPYIACEHGCKYCDGRSERYYINGDFEKDIVIKNNIVSNLERELKKIREPGPILFGSGVTDPYQSIELEEKIVKKCALILKEYNFPVVVITKSNNILRDIDIWEQVDKKCRFILMVSLNSVDDKQRKIFEPKASSVEERLELISTFKKRGFCVGVLAMPFLPGVSDGYKSIYNLGVTLKKLEVDFVIPGALTLREGRQKDEYLNVIKKHYPELLETTESLYIENRASGSPIKSYESKIFKIVHDIFKSLSIPLRTPHQIYKNSMPIYDEVYTLLSHMSDLYSNEGIDVSRLNKSLSFYRAWLNNEKIKLNRSKKMHYSSIEDELKFLLNSDMFNDIIKNRKLTQFITSIVIHKKTFDYTTLKILR